VPVPLPSPPFGLLQLAPSPVPRDWQDAQDDANRPPLPLTGRIVKRADTVSICYQMNFFAFKNESPGKFIYQQKCTQKMDFFSSTRLVIL